MKSVYKIGGMPECDMPNSKYIGKKLFVSIMITILYSFGTFGLLNLLGIRTLIQAIVIGLTSSLLLVPQHRHKSRTMLLLLIFPAIYAIGVFVNGSYMVGLIEAYLMFFTVYAVYTAPPSHVESVVKAIIIATSILCVLVITAYAYYMLNLDQLAHVKADIYSSEVGQQTIYPANFIDWISFASGEGYDLGGGSIPRMKGYSREPSSTVVHYLAPAVFAFLVGGRFVYLGVFILIINLIAIGSLIGHIVIFLSFVLFVVNRYLSRHLKLIAFVFVVFFITILMQKVLITSIFEHVGQRAIDYFGFDLIARKLGAGTGTGGSLVERQSGIIDGLLLVFSSPFGYSFEKLGSGAGLLYVVSSYSGWLGLALFGGFTYKLFRNAAKLVISSNLYTMHFGLGLLFATILIALLVSGYGWERPPGVVILLLYYRLIEIKVAQRRAVTISQESE